MSNKYVPPHARSADATEMNSSFSPSKQASFSSNVNNNINSVDNSIPNQQSSSFSSRYSSQQMTYNKPQQSTNINNTNQSYQNNNTNQSYKNNNTNQSYQNNNTNTFSNQNNQNKKNEYSFAPADSTNYDLGFNSTSNGNTNNTNNGYNNGSSSNNNSGGGSGGGDRFRRFGGGSGGGSVNRGGGDVRGRTNRYGNGNGNNNSRFTRPQHNNNNMNNNNNSSNNNNSNNRSYSTYTDRYSSASASTERNAKLERELFGDDNTVAQGINFKNYDKIPVEVSGREAPVACDNFSKSNLCPVLLSNIELCKYTTPTPIQKYAIPCVIQNRDIMACAQTGSGKTAAFLLPIIHNIYIMNNNGSNRRISGNNNRYGNNREVYPSAVVLSPTRELAIQIHVQARKFLYRTGLRTCVVYGGADWRKQARDLRYGVDIIVATPGRLNDFMERGFVSMSAVQYNVLDEADRMLDMGFMPQIKQIIREMPPKKSKNNTNNDTNSNEITRQTLMFSATFPLEIQKLAQDFLEDYIFIAVGRVGSTNTFIEQKLKFVEEYEKTTKLIEIITQFSVNSTSIPLTLIFVEKKRDCARVEKELIRSGYDAMSIHGDRSQREREHALKMFRQGKVSLLVATDVASRGLDIPNVLYVINYDLPNNVDAYVHRIGRTGRCGNNGNAISFVNETNKPVIKTLMQLLKESKSEIPQWFADLHYKFGSYGGFSQNKYGKNKYNSNKKYGARDFRHGRSGGGGGGYKRNTYSHSQNNNNNNSNRPQRNNMQSSANNNEQPQPQQQQWKSNQNKNISDSW